MIREVLRTRLLTGVLVAPLLATFSSAWAQTPTATTAVVSGTVVDATGGVMPGAAVVLTDPATNRAQETVTDVEGHYTFGGVLPGTYEVTVKMTGFATARVPNVAVEVARAYAVNIALRLGSLEEVVEVKAAGVELQRTDATVGTTLSAETVLRLPNPTRELTSIQFNQPLAIPYQGADASRSRGGSFAGARTDQNTYTLDGADVTDNVVGNNFLETEPSAGIPLPAESVEEFRVGSTNPNATFARASGGQLVVVTKRGTNDYRGSLYLYRQDDALNANSWTRERTGLPKPELKDSRFGGSIGGRIFRDKTFFFTNYEGRRFPRSGDITRLVPSDGLKAGVMSFRDAAGNLVNYNLRDWDPRGIGLNPVVRDLFNTLPSGNDRSQGDGLNVLGFAGTPDTTFDSDFAVLRIDHNLSQKWRLDASYRYASITEYGAAQVDIGGILPGHTPGVAYGSEYLPREPRFAAAGLSGLLSDRWSNEVRVGYNRSYLGFTRVNPSAQVPSANMALDIAGAIIDEPLDMVTGRSRSQVSNSRTLQITDNANWLKGSHSVSFGGTFRHTKWFFGRNDLLAGPLTALSATLDDGSFITIPAANRPPTCSATVTTRCLLAADVTRWNRYYTALLGLVDNVGVLAVRDGDLNLQPAGTFLDVDTTQNGWELYVNDAWRLSPSVTLSAGLNYQVYGSPKERDDRYAYLIDNQSGEVLDVQTYLPRARTAAEAGQPYNPQLAYQPLADSGRSGFYDTDYSNLGPRVALSWSPSYGSGIGGVLFGEGHGVLRGGYALMFDRQNNVNLGSWQMGVAFGQTLSVNGPRCNYLASPGASCNPAGTDPAAAFRVGVDGPAPTPTADATLSAPVVPATPFGDSVTRLVDPDLKNGRTHSFTLTYQREVGRGLVMETGWVMRLGRELNEGYGLSSVPYFFRDNGSGQTLAQAYDAVAAQLRSGTAAGAVTPQLWFENLVGPGQTAALASALSGDFIDGNLSNIWLVLNNTRVSRGLPSLSNRQIQTLWMRGDGGKSFYNAMFLSFRKRTSGGLTFGANYTLSVARDQAGVAQNTSTALSSAFDPDVDYGPSLFDRRHVLNATFVYDLPFARNAGGLKRSLLGDWYVAGVVVASSGVPLDVCQRAGVYGGGLQFTTCSGAINTGGSIGVGANEGVAGSGGIGTSGSPASGGTGVNIFADPEQVYRQFRPIRISEDTRAGRGTIYGLPRWNVDLSVGKRVAIARNLRAVATADVLNLFNTVQYSNPTLNLTSPTTFGVVTSQGNQPRAVQIGLRLEF